MLKADLETYINLRIDEYETNHRPYLSYFLWVIPLGDDWLSKVKAATKLKLELSGDPTVTYSDNEIRMLSQNRLGAVVRHNDAELPAIFRQQREEWRKRLQEEQENMHVQMQVESLCRHTRF